VAYSAKFKKSWVYDELHAVRNIRPYVNGWHWCKRAVQPTDSATAQTAQSTTVTLVQSAAALSAEHSAALTLVQSAAALSAEHSAAQCSAVQRSAAQRSAAQRSAVQSSEVRCSAVQCSAAQRSAAHQHSSAALTVEHCGAVTVAYIR
jgi:hypothetical protein